MLEVDRYLGKLAALKPLRRVKIVIICSICMVSDVGTCKADMQALDALRWELSRCPSRTRSLLIELLIDSIQLLPHLHAAHHHLCSFLPRR